MYTKSILASALLATCVAATSHEPMPASPPAHVAPPAAHVAPSAPPAHVAPPMANVHKQEQPPAANVHKQQPPPAHAPPPAVVPPPTAGKNAWADVKGAEHQGLTVHLVAVGDNNGSLKYFPDTVHAKPGEVVQFQFHPKNHTVTESTFDAPCVRKDAGLATPQRPGLVSGFVPVTGQEDTTPVYNVLVNDTEPIWIFCGQTPHCQRGMSMVINPPNNPERTIQKYQEAAAALPIPSPPAGGPPAGGPPAGGPPAGGPPAGGPPAGVSPPSSSPSAASPPNPPPAANSPAAAGAAQTSTEPAPATFTGAASKTVASSFGLGAFFLGVVALL